MYVGIEKTNGFYIIKIFGELSFNELEKLKIAVEDIFASDESFDLIIDFKKAKYIDSLAIGYLIKVYTRCRKYAKKLILANVNEHIMRIFTLTKMDKFFDIRCKEGDF